MSVQFGKLNFDGKPVDPKDLDEVRPVLAPYGPDGEGYISKDNVGILYRALHTTKESRREIQPHVLKCGSVIAWDGRLDNRDELISVVGNEVCSASTDLEIVASAYQRWGTAAFAKLIGDWALSIWDPRERALILAKDFIGTRQLYYAIQKDQVTWCTILDPLVQLAGRSPKLQEEYIAGWLSLFPAPELTPYVGIHSVLPSFFVRLTRDGQKLCKYWGFDPSKKIRYESNGQYEEHFRVVVGESVRRRLRSDTPILAELSGGMDSSSVVCMADILLAEGKADAPRLDTVSYYDDSEPNWDERPYINKVEARRGRTGCHIDTGRHELFGLGRKQLAFAVTPASIAHCSSAADTFASCVVAAGIRSVLTGVGGDEALGGVPTPIPEFADLVVRLHLRTLARQLKLWALNKRKPWFLLFCEVIQHFLPSRVGRFLEHDRPMSWYHPEFVKRHRDVLSGYQPKLKLFGLLPSFQLNMFTFEVLQRVLACHVLPVSPAYEIRHPYLDRDLLEFAFALPPDQLVRPGERRSLMRRALRGIVPQEVLNRKRKAFVVRGPRAAILEERDCLANLCQDMISCTHGFIDERAFANALSRVQQDPAISLAAIMRTIGLELWLRSLAAAEETQSRDSNVQFARKILSAESIPQ